MTTTATTTALRDRLTPAVDVPLDEIEIIGSPLAEDVDAEMGDLEQAGLLQLFEMILKSPRRLNRLIRRTEIQPALIPRFLAISLASFALFGVALAIVLSSALIMPRLTAMDTFLDQQGAGVPLVQFEKTDRISEFWTSGAAFQLISAYCFGLIAATGVCLPSLYFYGLLSGVRLSMLDVVTHAMKAKATSAVALLGILPVYIALAMGVLIFDWMPGLLREWVLWLGFILPFIAGLWGTVSLYLGFETLADTLPADRCERRGCFLRRLVVSWAACYTAVSPVMIYTVWQAMQGG